MKHIFGESVARRARHGLILSAAVTGMAAVSLAGCTISVPINEPVVTVSATAAPSYTAPTIQAGHNAAAVAAKNMSFTAGNTLSPNVPVTFNDLLGQSDSTFTDKPQPSEWKISANGVAGRTSYANKAGCKVTYWTTTNQGPLIVPEDDRASTIQLFSYLVPSILPSSLKDSTWAWVSEAGKKGPTISFLRHSTKAFKGAPANTVWARMLGTSNTGLMISISCPTDALLASTTPRVMAKLSVAPPNE